MPQPNETAIAELIARLLSHFATADEPLAVRRSIARDWLDDLAEFSQNNVQWATREWRRTQSMRPTIADIRKLATQAQRNDRDTRAITDRRHKELNPETVWMWEKPEFDGDARTWQQRRNDAIDYQLQRHARAERLRFTTDR